MSDFFEKNGAYLRIKNVSGNGVIFIDRNGFREDGAWGRVSPERVPEKIRAKYADDHYDMDWAEA